jgi:hypothetical protein
MAHGARNRLSEEGEANVQAKERTGGGALSENAKKLLEKLVVLGEGDPKIAIEDDVLREAAGLGYLEYEQAAEELVVDALAESYTNDYANLKVRPEGLYMIRGA